MKLFLKHLLRSIKRWPLQPIVLVLTVALSVAFCASSVSLRAAIFAENDAAMTVQYGSADLSVSANGGSSSRFMPVERANALLGDQGKAVGCFDLVLSCAQGAQIFAVASDLYEISALFDLSFVAYGSVSEDALSDAIFLTSALAESLDVSLGETVLLKIFGIEKEYTVVGISEKPLVGGREVLVDIRGVTEVLSLHSPLVSALGESFKPSTTLYIDLSEGVSAEQGIALLSADRDFADKTFTDLSPIRNSGLTTVTLNFLIICSIFMVTLVCAAVIFSCFYILSLKRSAENQTFISAGASAPLMHALQYAEAILYWIVGAPLGLLLSLPLSALFDRLIGFRYAYSAFDPSGAVLALLSALVAVLLTVAVFIKTRNSHRESIRSQKMPVALLILLVPAAIVSFLPIALPRLLSGVFAVCILIVIIFVFAPIAFRSLAAFLSGLRERKGKKSTAPSVFYALKNAKCVKSLHNTARLIAFLVAALICTGTLVVSAAGCAKLHERMIGGDFAVTNPTDRMYATLSEDTSADFSRLYQEAVNLDSGLTVFVLAADSEKAFGSAMGITKLPGDDEVILSSTYAKMICAEVGDAVSMKVNGEMRRLSVSAITSVGLPFAVVNGAHCGIEYNILLADAKMGAESVLFEKLSIVAAEEMSAVISVESLLSARVELLDTFLICGYIIAAALLAFALIGLLDNLYESYRHRRPDFVLYSCAGAARASIRKMKLSEIVYSITFGLVFGLVFAGMCLVLVENAMYSLNYEMFLCLKAFFMP